MVLQENSTQTERPTDQVCRLFGVSMNHVSKFISYLLLPLLLGVFSIVITVHQQNMAKQEWEEDQQIAQQQLQLERNLATDESLNKLFYTFIRETGALLEKYNGSLSCNPIVASLIRAKTLKVFGELEPQRNIRIIRFLYESGQIRETREHRALDLSRAELRDVDFRHLAINGKHLHHISLAGTFLSNALFIGIDMKHANFSSTHLENVDFSFTKLENVDFSSAQLENVNFSYADLRNVNFYNTKLRKVEYSSTELWEANFASGVLLYVDFSFTLLSNVKFSFTSLINANFSNASLVDINFRSSRLDYVNFSSANVRKVDFTSAQLRNVNFVTIVSASVNFSYANISYTNFMRAHCVGAYFARAILFHSTFSYANAKSTVFYRANLTDVEFSFANLYNADFADTQMTDSELWSALSIRDALLPNGTIARDPNLIKNGEADCNISLVNHWIVALGSVTTSMFDQRKNNCYFLLQSDDIGAKMFQRVKLSKLWDFNSWPRSQAVLNARMSSGVSVQLRGMSNIGEVFAQQNLNSTRTMITLDLLTTMEILEVFIVFNPLISQESMNSSWCDDIELFIEYGSGIEYSQGA
ncbi:unnamed protein product [Rotaria magnacalcarata]|uniref:Pentapeptide repeat-containing protein n=1 Tax=Rotaria magnacalcarata TaxID=392030 RepID=A0A819ZN34_9BILA|nr:unnamed protein product [Rotaria magnacalcarata]CAF4176869.1 unnamed protein product [Rotaria magnacalcarata]